MISLISLWLAYLAHGYDRICGKASTSSTSWIDVPTYWINSEEATERAEEMRTQLARALTAGTCATRVQAVGITDLKHVVQGRLLVHANGSIDHRYHSPTGAVEIALMASHLKAIYFARLDNGPQSGFLVLEDTANLSFFGEVRASRKAWPTAQLSAAGLHDSLPIGWTIAQLSLTSRISRWEKLYELWELSGQGTAILAERLTVSRDTGMSSTLKSSAAYLVSAQGAQALSALWPARVKSTCVSDTRMCSDQFEVQVTRSCWFARRVTSRRSRSSTPTPFKTGFVWSAGECLLHLESVGPAITSDELDAIHRQTPRSVHPRIDLLRMSGGGPFRTYVVTPPLVCINAANDKSTEFEPGLAVTSDRAIKMWWRLGNLTGVKPSNRAHAETLPVSISHGMPSVEDVSGSRWAVDDGHELWRFGRPELVLKQTNASRFVCADRDGCRAPIVLGIGNVIPIRGIPPGPAGDAFNPTIARLSASERSDLHTSNAEYVSLLRVGADQQCSSEKWLKWISVNPVSKKQKLTTNVVRVALLTAGFQMIHSSNLVFHEPKCEILNDCRLFRSKTRPHSSTWNVFGQLWASCMCYGSNAFSAPLVSPLVVERSSNGPLRAELPEGAGGFLYARKTPPSAFGRWTGGSSQRNQIFFESGGELYAAWSLAPASVVVRIPRDSGGPRIQNLTRGSLCCAEPVGLIPANTDPNIREYLGAVGQLLHLSAGFVHDPERSLLLGVAHAHRDLWRSTKGQSPAFGSHYTHLFFALSDKPPFELSMIGPEFCMPRSRFQATLTSRNAQIEDQYECDLIQFVTTLTLDEPGSVNATKSLILSYGIDDCSAAVVKLDYGAIIDGLRPLSHWKNLRRPTL